MFRRELAPDATDYEKHVFNNIKENESELQIEVFMSNIKNCKENIMKSAAKGERKRKHFPNQKMDKPKPKFVRRSARIIKDKNYNENSSDDDNDDNNEPKNKKLRQGSVKVKFDFATKKKLDKAFYSALNDDDFIDNDDDEIIFEQSQRPKRARNSHASKIPRLHVTQVTETMLSNITYYSSRKTYGMEGTTCHQCRQKTLDQKSYCRHKWCRGSRGMFCGFCLKNRYGEDVAEALMDSKWACPPCRGYCNCSICRRRDGKEPTGPMIHTAQAQGYNSVKDLLIDNEGESSTSSNSFESVDESIALSNTGQSSEVE